MTNYTEFTNPKLVAIYDAVNPIGTYTGFYLDLAKRLKAGKVIDLGCGTGLLSHRFVEQGHEVIGIEPAPDMLVRAKQKYANEAKWIIGSSEALRPNMRADLLVMTGHVAQFFLENETWMQTLQNSNRALKPKGYLAFESRNPNVMPFTGWPTKAHRAKIELTPLGPVEWWHENLIYADGYATYGIHYLFTKTGEEIVSNNKLRFRSQREIRESLELAGFTIKQVYGDWDRSLLQPESREMIFVAQKKP